MLLVGCVVQSVHPFYRESDVVYEPALLGKWTTQDEDNYHWIFEQSTTNSYKLTIAKGTNSSAFEVNLFKLEGQYFLDGYEVNDSDYLFAPHHLLMVRSLSPYLEVVPLDIDWLKDYLEENPRALKHTVYSRGESSYLSFRLSSASTPGIPRRGWTTS